jgi:N-acyl-D-aspartate/D-glutamate deacylase
LRHDQRRQLPHHDDRALDEGQQVGLKLPLEALVHGYTQRNAAHVGWRDRGVVAPGYLADLNIIDIEDLSLRPPQIVQDLAGRRDPPAAVRPRLSVHGEVRRGDVRERGLDRRNAGRLLRGERALAAFA